MLSLLSEQQSVKPVNLAEEYKRAVDSVWQALTGRVNAQLATAIDFVAVALYVGSALPVFAEGFRRCL